MKARFATTALLALTLSSVDGCRESRTTDTRTHANQTIEEKKAFLERYLTFRRNYEELDFHIIYWDNGHGCVPGPSEWTMKITAKVPPNELDDWIDGLPKATPKNTTWVSSIPNAPTNLSDFEWYGNQRRTVGVDRANRRVVYLNQAR